MTMLTQRTLHAERMDDPNVDRDQLARSLGFLRTINHRLGGVSALLKPLRRWSGNWDQNQTIRILDVGTGSADIPLAVVNWAHRHNLRMHVTAVDNHETTLDLAKQYIGDRDEIELVRADATQLGDVYEDNTFDYAHAGLFLHHLSDIEVMTVLRIMQRLARRAVIWNDLVRGALPKMGVWLATLGASQIVRHDGLVSVDAGFTKREAVDLAHRVGLLNPQFQKHMIYRFTLISETT